MDWWKPLPTITVTDTLRINSGQSPPLISRVQGNARGTATGGTTVAITLGSAPINGNVIVITCSSFGTSLRTISSISQTGVTWSGGGTGLQKRSSVNQGDVEIWLGTVQSGASKSIIVTFSGTILSGAVCNAVEYSGVATSSFLDQNASNSGSGTAPDTGTTATTTQSVELWIGATISLSNTHDTTQVSPTNGFTLLDGIGFNAILSNGFLEKIVSSTGTADSTTSTAPAVNSWAGAIATFKAAGGVGYPLVFSTTKQIFAAPQVNERISKKISKQFADILRMVETKILSRAYFFRDTLRIVESVRRTTTKGLFEGVRVIDYLMRVGPIHFLRFFEPISIRENFQRSANYIRTFVDNIRITDKMSFIARLVVGIAVALKTLGYFLEKRLHPTEREGDTPAV